MKYFKDIRGGGGETWWFVKSNEMEMNVLDRRKSSFSSMNTQAFTLFRYDLTCFGKKLILVLPKHLN